MSYSPGGRRLASAGGDGLIKIRDLASGRELLVLRGHTGPVYSVAFNPGGDRLASAGRDEVIRIWEARPSTIEPSSILTSD